MHVCPSVTAMNFSSVNAPMKGFKMTERIFRRSVARIPMSISSLPIQQRRGLKCFSQDQARLGQEYTYHTPGSVQEPGAENRVIFAHESPDQAEKWIGTHINHVGYKAGDNGKVRIGIVIGEFHDKLMNECLEDARLAAEQMDANITSVVWVPGTYEAPLVVRKMLERKDIDCVVVVGYIEKGSTLHGQEMGSTCSLILKNLELEFNKPVGMGIIGPGATAEQAATRVAYAGNATRAAVRMTKFFSWSELEGSEW